MKKTINDIELKNKKVLMRVDFNVPIKNGIITSNKRIIAALPTIKKVINDGGKLILFSHLGRIKEQGDIVKNDLFPVSIELSRLLEKPVLFVDSTRGKELENAISNMKPGHIILVQNTRFEDLNGKAESKNNPELAKYWASLGDVFINDAFGTAHRAHASNVGISTYIKESALGYLMQQEVESLSKAITNPAHPFVAIVGGAKVSDKIKVLENLITAVDKMIIGGGMSYTFKKALGYSVGTSLLENDLIEFAKDFLAKYGNKVILPLDNACTKEFADVEPVICDLNIPDDLMGMDIGPKSINLFKESLVDAKTVIWNGPMGVAEFNHFSKGTLEIAQAIAKLGPSCYSVVGGGDSVAAVQKLGMEKHFSHVSTGGGASLEFLQGHELPGVAAIQDK
ncbi:phosphoglycerate kinase [Mycoplasma tauri]|uniref:phosphoglycerate kinase n=1 Tax=Mycoplasma tauri TaxID=547987 RepID=UPI001967B229|nr:phosphoglycerate kinase [Mycoplasma tauri]QSB07410.1 phosphoglycerate kinase [Mycoplasma tauri]